MRKLLFVFAILLALSALAAYFLRPAATVAEVTRVKAVQASETTTAGQLPIEQIVLFSSGVGYFQRAGMVEGDARIDLSFPVSDINDLLKSMVLRDCDGGIISTVNFDSNAPIEKTLKSFAVNLNGNPSFAEILNQARGEKVEVSVQQTSNGQHGGLTGTIVGVEVQRQAIGKDTGDIQLLNLWCADGIRNLKMTDIQRLKFLNPLIDSEFKKSLETLSLSHDTQKKAVSIHCVGEGKRVIKVGYVVENPIWKTTYRLVLDKDRKEKPFLQGWAIVENPTDEDWKDVRMALISGRPISFQMNLYDPLYVSRPIVEPDLFASLRPVAYSGGGMDSVMVTERLTEIKSQAKAIKKSSQDQWMGLMNDNDVAGLPSSASPDRSHGGNRSYGGTVGAELAKPLNLGGGGAQSMATAAKLGDFFQYSIDMPVSLPRQKSAMLPIVNKDVEGTRVSIYNETTQAKFPLLGLKFKNTSGMNLMQGPITVFEGSNYAGDARILDLQPNEERLISYAVDLGTEVNAVPSSDNGRLISAKVVKGIIQTTSKFRESKTYTIVNRNDGERLVLVEHRVRNEFKLVDTVKPAETASDCYRFEVKVAAGKTETLTVTEEQTLQTSFQMLSTEDEQIRFFLTQPAFRQAVKDGLKKAQTLRWNMEKTLREIVEQDRQLKALTDDQARLRANLHEMPATSAAYKRYLEKFDQQETQIENYQKEIKKLQGVEQTQRKEFEDFLANFSAE